MPPKISGFLQRAGGVVQGFSVAQRTLVILGVAVLALGGFALTAVLTKPSYTPLFSGLQPSDASTIVEQLRADGVPYELSGGGSTILVPEETVYDQRLKAASAGLPSSTATGYALLDDMGVTSSEFQQSVTYKRALEGELAATVGALDGVKKASVRLAIPEETVFVSTKTEPTASVFVETQNGVTLTGDQIQAIVHLTSASIEGMKSQNVAVIDSKGTVLSAVGAGATGSADKQAADYEESVRNSVQSMLDRVVGPGNATVAVAADISRESAERVEEAFTAPEAGPALNESTKTETYEGTGGPAAGVLGPDNIAVPGGTGDGGTFNSEESTRNNAVNKVTESRTIPAGALNRQTVSVAVNDAAVGGADVAGITALVRAAAGIDNDRGDLVTVQVMPFNTAGAEAAAEALAAADAAAEAERMAEIVRTAIIATAIIVVLLLAALFYARRSRRQLREPVDLGERYERQPELVTIPAPVALDPPTASIDIQALTVPAVEAADIERKRAQIDALAGSDPERTAEYLRSLIDERQPV
ncbi:flagellar M-ring protein FliF [Pseudarthrobacter phenanthrenivorans]|uniref:Flagellar M-ring protein n=1 Tax=Pseudarthrobacter phenanthrenivorans TaxID=361575 RepID=A0A3B0F3Q6_PSEPS|nr:flagellar basal-body MS-ring/collar protein FliF [Pseudarthrobacter phenanthrenivorans]RKO21556.1 flagellar M-ring protein FliF [Pseudarthrobacter phenanthrenivorans]